MRCAAGPQADTGSGRPSRRFPEACPSPRLSFLPWRALLSGLTVWCWLWAANTPPVLAGNVAIVDDPDVDQAAVDTVHQAIAATLDLFREEFGLTLDHDVRLVLTTGQENYAEALVRRNRQTRDAAAGWAAKSAGVSSRNLIVENLGPQHTLTRKVFVAAHELTHQFEDQASEGRMHAVAWLCEGVADYIAAKVVEQAGLGSLAGYRKAWARQFGAAATRPRLEELHGVAAWAAAGDRYGGDLIYRAADLAVLQLVELRGEKALFAYFRQLRRMEAEHAFQETFGLDLRQFERQTEQ